MKFRKEKGVFEENVFSNICSTHKNAPKKYPTILKFEKRKKMTCPIEYTVSTVLLKLLKDNDVTRHFNWWFPPQNLFRLPKHLILPFFLVI